MASTKLVAGCIILALLFSSAAADSKVYSAADIVSFFAGSGDEVVTRGICVGSDAKCPPAKKLSLEPFDLRIDFAKSSSELTPDAQNKLMQLSFALRHPKLANLRFAVEGFTDASGSASYNLGLSQRRAQSVMSFLIDLGIDQSRLTASGYGASHPREPDPFDPSNRRVETRIIGP